MTFMEQLLRGKVTSDQIEDFIEEWHESDSELDLHDYLGMTWDTYCEWLRDANYFCRFKSQ